MAVLRMNQGARKVLTADVTWLAEVPMRLAGDPKELFCRRRPSSSAMTHLEVRSLVTPALYLNG
jgi:hypothetical protein